MTVDPYKWYIYNQPTFRTYILYILMSALWILEVFNIQTFPAWLNWTIWIVINILYIFNLYVWRKSRPNDIRSNMILIVGIIMLLFFWVFVGFVNFMLLYND